MKANLEDLPTFLTRLYDWVPTPYGENDIRFSFSDVQKPFCPFLPPRYNSRLAARGTFPG
jgi:hypothetical protein